MKKILALILALCMVFCLAACGNSGSTSNTTSNTTTSSTTTNSTTSETTSTPDDSSNETAEKETVSLTVWVGDNYPAVTEQMIESFKAAHPEVNFEITVGIESESTCKDTVLTDPTAAADVFTFADDQLNELVNAGALQEVVLNPDEIIAANSEGAIGAASKDGKLYAYPMSASNGYFLYYDSNFFTEEDVQSLNTMVEKAAAAGKTVGMQFGADGGWYIYSFFAGAGLTMVINDDGMTNTCDWNCETGVAVAQGILDLVATGGFRADSTSNLVSGAADGSVVALVDGTWDSGAIMEAFGDGYACCKLPTFNVDGEPVQMASFAGYKLIGVNPHSANVGWAMELAAWLTNEANQTLRFEDQGDGPSNLAAAASDAVAANPAIAALAAQSQYAVVQRVGGNYWTPAASLGTILSTGNPDGTDLMELLDTAVAGITAPVA